MAGLREIVCENLCAYHKPGKVEEPGCGGLVRLRELKSAPEALRAAFHCRCAVDGLSGLMEDDPLLLEVCTGCEYFVDGCDFRDPLVPRCECSPCGGIKAVAFLLSSNPELFYK